MSRVFDGSASNYITGDFGAGNELSLPVTMFCWTKVTDWDTTAMNMIALGATSNSNTNSLRLYKANVADQCGAGLYDESAVADQSILTFASANEGDGIWVAIMATYNSTTSRQARALYPRQNSTEDTTSRAISALRYIRLSARLALAGDLTGNLAEVAIWSGVSFGDTEFDALVTASQAGLSPDQVQNTYLKGYWSFKTDAGGTIADESGNGGPSLTVNGTVAYNADHPTITYGSSTPKGRMMLMGIG